MGVATDAWQAPAQWGLVANETKKVLGSVSALFFRMASPDFLSGNLQEFLGVLGDSGEFVETLRGKYFAKNDRTKSGKYPLALYLSGFQSGGEGGIRTPGGLPHT